MNSFLAKFVFSKFGHLIGLLIIAAVEALKKAHPEFENALNGLLPYLLDALGLSFMSQSKPLFGAAAVITNDGEVKHISPTTTGAVAVREVVGK